MANRLKIKIGAIEFEYEGDAEFTQDSIKDLFSHMETLFATSASNLAAPPPPDQSGSGSGSGTTGANGINMHINSLASKLAVKTGPDLAVAAVASLQLGQGKTVVTRHELHEEMKNASSYYQTNMGSNLTSILKSLVTNHRLNQITQNSYALNIAEQKSIEAKLA